eukprot:TRINITY_DN36751_c0_g1_i2.p1 TRINITY_DN36751_c0_g1~~TRINITY_DN36751_c0_g1_i2.p1  ORF type:complete len:288 (+),score=91.60 TRINITY_DN36751_c0_g1_i2:406-1269(+)
MMYLIVADEHPFAHEANKLDTIELFRKILNSPLRTGALDAVQAEPALRELITQLLVKRPAKRLTAKQALSHAWLQSIGPHGSNSWQTASMAVGARPSKSSSPLDKAGMKRIRTFGEASRLEKTVLTIMAHLSHYQEVADLRESFAALDLEGNGTLSKDEIRQGITNSAGFGGVGVAMCEEELEVIFSSLDLDGTGKVHWTEWLAATLRPGATRSKQAMKQAFDFMDIDGSGRVSRADLRELLGDDAAATEALEMADTSGDGHICWEEFQKLFEDLAKKLDSPRRQRS